MLDITVKQFCENSRLDKYGGSAEMVEDAIKALINSISGMQVSNLSELVASVEADIDSILDVIPTISPMINLLHRLMGSVVRVEKAMLDIDKAREELIVSLKTHLELQNSALEQIGFIGSQMIKDGAKIATFSTSGSVYRIFQHAVADGKKFSVTGHEARPGNEGYRTLKETSELGIPVTFGIDAILGYLIPGSSFMVIGADAVTSIGDVLAKVGSYLGALVCKENNIPFYVAADTSKFDTLTLDGFPIKDRFRPPEEVSEISVPKNSKIVNLSFELIPARLISGIITEMGVIHPASVAGFMKPSELSPRLIEKLRVWLKEPTRL